MKKLLIVAVVITVFAIAFTSNVANKARAENVKTNRAEPATDFVRGRLLVKFRENIARDHARQVIAALGTRDADEIPNIGVHILDLPYGASEQAFMNAFRGRLEVEFAELDRIVQPADVVPNDPWYVNTEWHLRKIAAPAAWEATTGNSSIVIAILDTGVSSTHPDLAENMTSGWNVYSNNADSSDITGHGTLVAGTAAASSNNALGVASVAWRCRLMPIRITDSNGFASYSNMANGLMWAADHGARIANLSFTNVDGATVTTAAKYFAQKGGVVVSAAGNDGATSSASDNAAIINVSGTDPNDALYSWSNRGSNIDLSAPGYVYTTSRNGAYTNAAGTSVAAPIVAGVAALLLSVKPELTPGQILDLLKQSADDLGPTGWDGNYGWGRVNAARAVQLAGGGVPTADVTPPSVQFVTPSAGATLSGIANLQGKASDNVNVSSLTLTIDGAIQSNVSAGSLSIAWDTTKVSNGLHTLTLTASDAAGNTATSSVSVNVNNVPVAPPSITITSPVENGLVSGTVSVLVNVTSSAPVLRVELYADGVLTSTSTSAPFTNKWNARKEGAGNHTLQCVVYDAAGYSTRSAAVTVRK